MNHDPRLDLAVPVSEVDHVLGSSLASMTIVEYGDFECPLCKQTAAVLKHLLERFSGRIRIIYRHFPLAEVHPHALGAAEAAECAAAQGKFWQMHDLLFDSQGQLTFEHLHGYAQRLGLDVARYEAEMDNHVHLQRIREHMDSGRESHVRSTPGLFLNGRIVDVSFGLRMLYDAIHRIAR
jgi:protein-disulfide isomerase